MPEEWYISNNIIMEQHSYLTIQTKSFGQGLYVQCVLQANISMQIMTKKNTGIRKTSKWSKQVECSSLDLGVCCKTASDMLGRFE